MKKAIICTILTLQLFSTIINAQIIPDSLRTDWSYAGVQSFYVDTSNVANVMNFGATGNGITNDYTAIVNAINSLSGNSGIVYFPPGNYLVGSTLSVPDSVTLKGAGADATTLTFDFGGVSGNCINLWQGQTNTFMTVTGGYAKGSYKLTVANSASFAAGDYAEIHEDNGSWDTNPAGWAAYSVGQIVQVDSVSGDTLFIRHPLRIDYDSSLNVKIVKINPRVNAGLECFKLTRTDSTAANLNYAVYFSYAANCWMRGVESDHSIGAHVWAETSTSLEISGCYFHHAYLYDGGSTRGYGVVLGIHTGESKIENNIFRHLRHAMMVKQGANGNAYMYNYSIEPTRSEPIPDASGDMILHGHYPFLNLFEGNICQNLQADQAWGPAGPFNTFFRNRIELYGIVMTTGTQNTDQQNFVGNDLTGTGPFQGNYILTGTANFTHGNYVQIQSAFFPPGTNVLDDTSYYYTSTPSFWNIAEPFPNIGTPNSTTGQNIPARERYLSGTNLALCEPAIISGNEIDKGDMINISVLPSLFSDHLTVSIYAKQKKQCEIKIYDVAEKIILKKSFSLSPGINSVNLDTPHLINGIYFVSVNDGNPARTFKCVKAE
jgi:hypothetical protein